MANWKITTGYIQRINFIGSGPSNVVSTVTIPSTINEQTRPTNIAYVAKWGNDTTGNGSRDRPFLTVATAKSVLTPGTPSMIVLGTGVYNTTLNVGSSEQIALVGDGAVIIDGTTFNNFITGSLSFVSFSFSNLTFNNFISIGLSLGTSCYSIVYNNCVVDKVTNVFIGSTSVLLSSNTFSNINLLEVSPLGGGAAFTYTSFSKIERNNSFINIKNVRYIAQPLFIWSGGYYNVFKNCNIQYQATTYTDYNVYHNCNFRFNTTAGTQPTGFPEDSGNTYVPTGWMATRPTTSAAIQAGQVAAGFAGVGFANSIVQTDYPTDPNFNNISLLDFTLKPTSPARNLAYEGTFVGAKSVGTPLVFRTIQANGNWNNSGATNLTVVDDSATLTTDSNAVIESNVVDLGKDKVLRAISMLGLLGNRNGEWVDTSTDLDSVTTASGSNLLIANQSYIVEVGTVTYNGVLYQVGQKFAVISGTLDYTPTGGGVVRKIIEAPNRVCYEMRISSVSAVDCSAQSYFKYEFGVQPSVNKVGNVSSGAISKGNGDITFDRTVANVFLLSAQWIQIRLNVQNNNLV